MARIYYVGDWAISLGPVFAETLFNCMGDATSSSGNTTPRSGCAVPTGCCASFSAASCAL